MLPIELYAAPDEGGGLAAGEALMTQEVIEHIASLVEQKGTDIWWQVDTAALLPDSLQSQAETLKKGLDTMDVYVACTELMLCGYSTPVKEEASVSAIDCFQKGEETSLQHIAGISSCILLLSGRNPLMPQQTHGFAVVNAPQFLEAEMCLLDM